MRHSDGPEGWIGVDLDRTLAHRDSDGGPEIGPPIQPIVDLVKNWLSNGQKVKIFSARFSTTLTPEDRADQRTRVEAWCLEHIGQVLPCTAEKDYYCRGIWDDLAVSVYPNTGEWTCAAMVFTDRAMQLSEPRSEQPLDDMKQWPGPPLPL
jgi:hypothetical protein